ncbi:hypothetical protein [Silvimonas sp.]|nr:hypothetical protein [Silvimonas sp.]MDR3429984.1 hypothetical protein [Silvimonas sp.]
MHRASHVRIWRLLQEKKAVQAAQLPPPPTEQSTQPEADTFTIPLPWDH